VQLKQQYSVVFMFLILAVGEIGLCQAQTTAFAGLDFGGNIYIEVPRNWVYLDNNLRRHLDTNSEAVVRLAGLTPNSGENVILVAGNANTTFRTSSATLRLSVRRGEAPTQENMREISNLPKKELTQLLAPISEDIRSVMVGIDEVKSVKAIDAKAVTNQGMTCMFFEFETDTLDGVQLSQTYLCPFGTQSIKFSTSYRKSEAILFRPVLKYAWQSLRVN
jgi:hypothetical protein